MNHPLVGYWAITYTMSNRVQMSVDALGDVRFSKGLGQEDITVSLEDLQLAIKAFVERTK